MKAFIKGISYYLPEKVLTNNNLADLFPEWSVEKIASKIGISQRHISDDSELSSDMAIRAASNLFNEYSIDPQTVDFVMLCTQSPDYFLPTTACIIQDRLNIPTCAGALDFNLGCSGYIYGLALAKGLVECGVSKNVLLLTGETYTKFIHQSDKGNRAIFGDAATATLISTDGFASIENFDLGTDGKGCGNLIVKNGGLRSRTLTKKDTFNENGNMVFPEHLYMNGAEIFDFTLETVPTLVANVLTKNSLKQSDISLYVFHQANKYMLNHLRKKMLISEEHFYYYMENVGNTVSSTIPIALYEANKACRIKKNQNVMLAGFGVGYSWGGTIIKFNK